MSRRLDGSAPARHPEAVPCGSLRPAVGRIVGCAVRFTARDEVSRRMLRGATLTASGSIVGRGIGLVAALAAARLFGASDFGRFSLALVTVNAAAGALGLGLPRAATRLIALYRVRSPARARRLWLLLLLATAGVALGAGAAALAVGPPVGRALFGAGSTPALLAGTSWWFVATALNNYGIGALLGAEAFRSCARWTVARSLAPAIALLSTAALGQVTVAVLASALAETVVALGMFGATAALFRTPATAEATRRGDDLHEIVATAAPAWGSAISLQPALWAVQLFLAHSPYGYSAVGIFAVSQRALTALSLVPNSIGLSAIPILTERWVTGARRSYTRAARHYLAAFLLFTVPIALLAAVTSPWTVPLVLGANYRGHWAPFAILIVAAIPAALNSLLNTMAQACGRMVLWAASDVALGIVLTGLSYLLIPSRGAVGGALAYLAALVATVLVLIPVARQFRLPSAALAPTQPLAGGELP